VTPMHKAAIGKRAITKFGGHGRAHDGRAAHQREIQPGWARLLKWAIMLFEFATARRVIFGPGASRQAGEIVRKAGRRALVVTGRDEARSQFLLDLLRESGVSVVTFRVADEPSIDTVEHGVETGLRQNCEVVVSLGGGSALDTGKAVAAMLTNAGDLLDYVEVIGNGKSLTESSTPFIAIPTTAGTGSEATRNRCWLLQSIVRKSACAARRWCPAWPSWTPS